MLSKREAARQVLRDIKTNNENKMNIMNGTKQLDGAPDSPIKGFTKHMTDYRDRFKAQCQEDGKVFATKFSPNASLVAMADSNGNIEIFDTIYGYSEHKFNQRDLELPLTTCLAWKKSSTMKLTQKMVGGCVDGSIITWQSPFEDSLQRTMLNENNQYQTIDYSCTGERFAIAGKLPQLEVYDDATLKQTMCFEMKNNHRNRIFTAKFSHVNKNLVYTGSWDRTIKFWDLRTTKKTMEFHVPQICGESVDLKANDQTLVIGSGEIGPGIQLWDLRKQEKFQSIDWLMDTSNTERNPVITYCQFNQGDKDVIVACATHEQPAKAFQMQENCQRNYTFSNIEGTVLSADMSQEGDLIAFGNSKGQLSVKSLQFSISY